MRVAESVLEPLGGQLIQDLRASQQEKGLRTSGKSADSLSFDVIRKGKIITLTVYGASYWRQQEKGRGPNKIGGRPSRSFVKIIAEWIEVKGLSIPVEAAGAIAYKIVNEGITVPNGFNPGGVVSEPLGLDRVKTLLIPSLQSRYLNYLSSELLGALKDGST